MALGLGVDLHQGLSAGEAERRLRDGGPNELPRIRPPGPWRLLARQFQDVLLLVLLGAIALSVALGHGMEAVAIAVIVAFSVALGFFEERRAQNALEALRRLSAPRARVVRDGRVVEVPARDVVPGDVFLLAQGDLAPADGRLVEAADLQAGEASLTGESVPVEKDAKPVLAPDAALGDRRNMVFASTIVTHGRGRAVAVATGGATEVGRIGALLAAVEPPKTPLERQLARLARWLVRAGGVVVLLVVVLGLLRGQPLAGMLLFGVALAVAVVPEALPAVVTISLALGAQRMARRNALVRRLPTVETLGSTTVICSDKTGTLTTGEMTVAEIVVAGGRVQATGAGYDPAGRLEPILGGEPASALQALLRTGCLCSDAHLERTADGAWRSVGDPTEAALLVAAAKAGLDKRALEALEPRHAERPFTSERKRMTTLHRRGDGFVSRMKGAPEAVLAASTRFWGPGGVVSLTEADREAWRAEARELAGRAMRVLALAYHPEATHETAEDGLVFLGLVGMRDPPRPEAAGAIATCHAAGIRPVMVTGDHPETARAVAGELGILRGGRVVAGPELDAMDDADLAREAAGIDVYARVSPEHKLRIVSALQARDHVVAMTGDGVNDAPALRKADIGIAMGITGTDVAKEAAAMTLADDHFATIVAAVKEGRAIFDNVRKYLVYLLSTNFGEVVLIAATMLLGMPLPLTAVQILYVNLLSDGLPALALAVDPHEPDLMRRPPRPPGRAILDPAIVRLMLLGGVWSGLANLGVFTWALRSGRPMDEAMTITFVCLVLIQFVKAYVFRSERHSILERPFTNRWLNLSVLAEGALLVVLVYVPALQAPFGTYPLSPLDWAVLLGAALTIVPVLEGAKWLRRRAEAANGPPAVNV